MAESCGPEEVGVRLAVIEERLRGDDKEWLVFKTYAEQRWDALNGEASRLKTILDSSVLRETFENYKDSQRTSLEQYRNLQTEAFNKYANEVGVKLANINKQIARWSGGIAAIVILLQLWLKYGGKS